jgi:MFS family permease
LKDQRSTYAAVLVLFAVNVLNFYDRNIAGALTEPMRKEFGLTDTQIGLLGSAFIWIYAVVGVPFGRIADRWSRKKLLVGGLLIWTSLTAFAGLASSYAMLLASRLGVGVGEAVCAPTGTSWLGDLFPPDKRARVLAIFMLGVPIGGALSYFISGPAAQAWGWRTAMVIASLPALILVPALLMLKEPQRGASEQQPVAATHTADGGKNPVMAVLSIPTLWWIIASGVFLNFNMYAIGTFMPALLSRVHKLSLAASGTATGITYILGGIGGGLIAGYFGDRIIRTHPNGRLVIASVVSLIGAPLAYFGVVQPAGNIAITLVCLTTAYGTMNTYYGLVYSSIQDIVAPTQRGLTMALYFMAMYLCGASFGPLLTGSISDRMARQAMADAGASQMTEVFKAIGLQQAMVIIPVLSAALAVVLWMASRTFVKDVAKRDRAMQAISVGQG